MFYPTLEAKRLQVERFIKDAIACSGAIGLQPTHLYILHELYKRDKQHATSLAKSVGQIATSFTPILDRLEGLGYIERQPDPNDRRAVFICLTANGIRLQNTITQLVNKIEDEFGGK